MWCVNIYDEILLSSKRNEILPFVMTWMELESIILNKISLPDKEKHHFNHMWNFRNKAKEQRGEKSEREKREANQETDS